MGQGRREGGQEGTITPGPMDFRGPMTVKNQRVKLEIFFVFGDHLFLAGKKSSNFDEALFFGDLIIFRTKLRHFFRPF